MHSMLERQRYALFCTPTASSYKNTDYSLHAMVLLLPGICKFYAFDWYVYLENT